MKILINFFERKMTSIEQGNELQNGVTNSVC